MGKFLIFCWIQLKFYSWLYKNRWHTSWKFQLEISSNKKVITKKPLTNLYEMNSKLFSYGIILVSSGLRVKSYTNSNCVSPMIENDYFFTEWWVERDNNTLKYSFLLHPCQNNNRTYLHCFLTTSMTGNSVIWKQFRFVASWNTGCLHNLCENWGELSSFTPE